MYHNKLTEQIKSSKNKGNVLENLVFIILDQNSENITYIKDTYEIDFFDTNTLIQVSYSIEDEKTSKRELNAFKYFEKISSNFLLITYDMNEVVDNVNIVSIDNLMLNGYKPDNGSELTLC